jgi:hypothetical protein
MASLSRCLTVMRYAELLIAMAVLQRKSGRSSAEQLSDDILSWVAQSLFQKAGKGERH